MKSKLLFLSLFLVPIMLFANSLKSKTDQYNYKLSSSNIQFSTPTNYSKDFPKPDSFTKNINIYDIDIYNDSKTTSTIQEFYFDFGKGFIFGDVNGTLKAVFQVRKTSFENAEENNNEKLIKILNHDFSKDYSSQDLKDFGIVPPATIKNIEISDITWSHYEYSTNDEPIYIYAIPLPEQYYLQVLFKFIDNSPGEKNNWKEQANEQLINIMQSFSISPISN